MDPHSYNITSKLPLEVVTLRLLKKTPKNKKQQL